MPELLAEHAVSLGLAYKAALMNDKVAKASRKEILRQVKRLKPLGHVPGFFITAVNMARVYEQPVVKKQVTTNLKGLPGEKGFGTFLAGWRTEAIGASTESWLPETVGLVAVRDDLATSILGQDIVHDLLYGFTSINDIDELLHGIGGGNGGSVAHEQETGWGGVAAAGAGLLGAILGSVLGLGAAGVAIGAAVGTLLAALWDAIVTALVDDEEGGNEEDDEEDEEAGDEEDEDENHGIVDETGPGWLVNTDFAGQETAFVQLTLAAGLMFRDAFATNNTVVLGGPQQSSPSLVLAY